MIKLFLKETTYKFLEDTLQKLESNYHYYPFDIFHFLDKSEFSFSERKEVIEVLYTHLEYGLNEPYSLVEKTKNCAYPFFKGTYQDRKNGLFLLIKKTLESSQDKYFLH